MSDEVKLNYDAGAKRAVLTFKNGKQLAIANVTAEQANAFKERHAAEFLKRDFCLSTIDGAVTRESDNG